MDRKREVANFACGAEAFHDFVHIALWCAGARFRVFGITQTPRRNIMGAAVNAVASVLLGSYAWGSPGRRAA